MSESRLPRRWECRVSRNRDWGFNSPSLRFKGRRTGGIFSFYADAFDKNAAQPSFDTDRSRAFDKNQAHARTHGSAS
jgi:hypothetical protein